MPKRQAPSTLTGHAADIWEAAYASAWKSWDAKKTGKTQEAYSSAVAWAAVKSDGYSKNKKTGKWVKKSLLASKVNFRLRITKSRVDGATGKIRFHAQAANDELDGQDEALHPSLFDDLANTFLIVRDAYDSGKEPPVFQEKIGVVQEPILDLSHYSSTVAEDDRNKARLGIITKLYRDGRYLHADGFFDSTPVGNMVAKAIAADEEGKIRVSVGFYPDWGNISIEDDVLIFKGGRDRAWLDHLAVTSVPRIKTTSIDVKEVIMSDATTIAEDAAAILGDSDEAQEFIAELEELADERLQETRSMVIKSEGEETEESGTVAESEVVEDSPDEIPDEGGVGVEMSEATEPVEDTSAPETESAVEDDELVVEAETTEREKVEKAQKARSKKYGIAILDVGQKTKPKKWGSLSDAQFGDPVNYRFPIHDKAHADNAAARFAQEDDTGYKGRGVIGKRIKAAQKKFGTKAVKKESEVETAPIVEESGVGEVAAIVDEAVNVILHRPYGGATSFDAAVDFMDASKERWRISDGWNVLQDVMQNVLSDVTIEDKSVAIEQAMSQYQAFLKSDRQLWSDTGEEDSEEVSETQVEKPVTESIVAVSEEVSEESQEATEEVLPTVESVATPPEATPMSVVNVDDVSALGTPHKAGRASTFGAVLDKIGDYDKPRTEFKTMRQPVVAETPVVVDRGDVASLVRDEVALGMAVVLEEVRALGQSFAVKEKAPAPQPPQRKSVPPLKIDPAAVTTRAQTFTEVLDRLREQDS